MIAEIRVGDALRALRAMADRSVAGIVTAPRKRREPLQASP